MRRSRLIISLLLLFLIGSACGPRAAETTTFDLPAEIVPDWVNPADVESLFGGAGCWIAIGDGVRILQVLEETMAAGLLRAGDILTEVDGVTTTTREMLFSVLAGRPPGDVLAVEGIRAGAPFSLEVELSSLPEDPERVIMGIIPETRLRAVQLSDLGETGPSDPLSRPVVLNGEVFSHSVLAATWVGHPDVQAVRAVQLGSELYAVVAGDVPGVVRLRDGYTVPVDPEPVPFESAAGTVDLVISGLDTMLASVGDQVLVGGRVTGGEFSTFAILAVDPTDGSVAWTRPLGFSRSGLLSVALEGYRSPSGERAVIALVEQDPTTGARSAVLTYYLLDERGEGVMGPPGIDRFMPTSGITGWYDDRSLVYVTELAETGVGLWDLETGDHSLLWTVPASHATDLITVTPVGDGRHLIMVRPQEVSLVDVFQPEPVRPIARGCSYGPIDGVSAELPVSVMGDSAIEVTTPAPVEEPTEFVLTILHSGAGESSLLPDEGSIPGVGRFSAVLKELQAGALGSGLVTLASGGSLRASIELQVSSEREGRLYDSVALSGLYDALVLGSRDFDMGPDLAARFIGGFTPSVPFLAANLDATQEPVLQALADRGLISGSTVIETGGQQIGVIGVVRPALGSVSSPRFARTSAVLPAVLAEVAALEGRGVDKIILVTHLQDLFEAIRLGRSITGVDVIVSGNAGHLLRNEGDSCLPQVEPIAGYPIWLDDGLGRQVPMVAAPSRYRCVGQLDVVFDAGGNVIAAEGRSVGVGFDVMPDADVQAGVVVPLAVEVGLQQTEVVGSTEVEIDGRRSTVRTNATNAGNLLADALRHTAARRADAYGILPPQVAIGHGGSILNNATIPPGEITTTTTWGMAPIDSFVAVGEVPREAFHLLLEQALDLVPEPADHFPQISGFTLTYDPAAPAREVARSGDCSLVGDPGGRVREVILDDGSVIVRNGEVLAGDPVVLATLDYLALGGLCYPLAELPFTNLGVTYRQALVEFISTDLGGVVTAADYPQSAGDRIMAASSQQ